jgi:FtsH-binding integral membrane protein
MVASTAARSSTSSDAGALLPRVYIYLALGLLVSSVVAYFGERSGVYPALEKTPGLVIAILAAPVALVLWLSSRIERMTVPAAHVAFWTYAALVGFSFSGIAEVYAGVSIVRAFLTAGCMFVATSFYAFKTRTVLAGFAPYLLMGLISIVMVGLVNIILGSNILQLLIELFGLTLFIGLVAYDTQRIKNLADADGVEADANRAEIIAALTIYLDFINLFITLLQLRRWGFTLVRNSYRLAAWSRLLATSSPRSIKMLFQPLMKRIKLLHRRRDDQTGTDEVIE